MNISEICLKEFYKIKKFSKKSNIFAKKNLKVK